MWRVTVRGLRARRVRLISTALAVVLGVAFLTGTFVLTDTLHTSFDRIFAETATGTDLVVRSVAPFGDSGSEARARVPQSLATQVLTVPGVRAASGVVQGYAQFVKPRSRTAIQSNGAPTIGISWVTTRDVGPLRILRGRPPAHDDEVAMDAGTARRYGFEVGETVDVLLRGPAERFRIVGTFGFGNQFDLGGVTVAAFDLRTAQRVFDASGLLDGVDVAVTPGTRPSAVAARLRATLGPSYEVVTGLQAADDLKRPLDQALGYLQAALLGFAAVGVLVGAFIIFNTFGILVSQRTRELGLLRSVGASGAQVVVMVVGEACATGLLASALGIAAGVGFGRLLLWLLPGFGLTVPHGAAVFLPRTAVAAVLVGVGVTVAACLVPALRAARVKPVAAIGDPRLLVDAPPARLRATVGAVLGLAGAATSWWAAHSTLPTTSRVAVAFAGVFVVFVGVVLLGPVLARPLASVAGYPVRVAFGVTGTLARANAQRNPRRTSATASALVVGLGLVSLVAIFAASAQASIRGGVRSGVRADAVLTANQLAGFSPSAAATAQSVPGVEAVSAVRFGDARVEGRSVLVAGVDWAELDRVLDLGFSTPPGPLDANTGLPTARRSGSLAAPTGGGLFVEAQEARQWDKKAGDSLVVDFPRIGPLPLTVTAVFDHRQAAGAVPLAYVVPMPIFDSGFGTQTQDTFVFVKFDPTRRVEAHAALVRALRGPFPNVTVSSREGFRAEQERSLDTFLGIFAALLLLSEVIAVLGIVNTLLLSVYERTHELALLRVVGMSRRQLRRLVRGEALIVAAIGCVLGLAVGVMWGWAVSSALRGQGVTLLRIPWGELALLVVAALVAAVAAAVLPGRRAARLDLMEALAQE